MKDNIAAVTKDAGIVSFDGMLLLAAYTLGVVCASHL
jgi:hypothetical protein